jgi:hypothetical protein
MKDSLQICPKCGSDACYVTPINSTNNKYFCFGCGFETTDFMKQNEFNFEEYEDTIPELYKDIKVMDDETRVWYPTTINIYNKGTVFVHGTDATNWEWAGVKVKEVTEEEKGKFKIPGTDKFYEHKTDMTTLKKFGRHDFMEALDFIKFFEE